MDTETIFSQPDHSMDTEAQNSITSMMPEADSNTKASSPIPPPSSATANRRRGNRRAARACLACRARKVRCDVEQRSPCGNCTWDGVECVVAQRRRPKTGGSPVVEKTTWMQTMDLSPSAQQSDPKPRALNATTSHAPSTLSEDPALQSVNTDMRDDTVMRDMDQLKPLLFACNNLEALPGSVTSSTSNTETPPTQNTSSERSPDREVPFFKRLPPFITPLAPHIPLDDVAYLYAKGALALPSAELQKALLESFFEYVYPYMPILDIEDFLQAIEGRDGKDGEVSLLLHQAILFAGSAYVDMNYLADAGFKSRRAARETFFQRARLLYDFNCEPDRFVLVQALAMMTLWFDTSIGSTWHWIDVTISQAFAAGLHMDPAGSVLPFSDRVQRLRKRVWWSCFMRDRLLSLAMRRPPRIKDDSFTVPLLEEDDFMMVEEDLHGIGSRPACSYVWDKKKRNELAELCISMADLCRCLKCPLRSYLSMFEEQDANHERIAEVLELIQPKDVDGFASCAQELLVWYNGLPSCCRYTPLSTSDTSSPETAGVAIHRTVLHMVYYTAVANLYRSRFVALLHNPGASVLEQDMSTVCMLNAATQISHMADELHHMGYARFLPTAGITIVTSAAIIHLLEMKGQIQGDRDTACEGFARCMRVIEALQDIYVAADLAQVAMKRAFEEVADVRTPSIVSCSDAESWPSPSRLDETLLATGTPSRGLGLDELGADSLHVGKSNPSLRAMSPQIAYEDMVPESWLDVPMDGFDMLAEFLRPGETSARD